MQTIKNNIKRDYFWNTLGVFAQNIISPVLLIVVARLNGVYDVGLFSFALSLAIIFWAFSIWGARTYQVSDVKKEFTHSSYVLVRVLLSVLVVVGAYAFCVLNNYDTFKTSLVLILVLYKTFESIADAIYGILQVHNRLYITGRSLLYKAILGLITFVVIDKLTGNILLSSLGLAISNIFILIVYDIPRAKKFETVWDSSKNFGKRLGEALQIIKRCAPIASVIFMAMFSLLIPRYFVDMYDQQEIGYFGILAMPVTAFVLVITFIIQPNVVHLSQSFFSRKYAVFRGMFKKILLITGVVSILALPVVYLFGTEILTFIFGIDFSQYREALLLFVVGAILNGFVTIYVNILTIMRHFKIQFYTLVVTNVSLILACLMIVPLAGIRGAIILYVFINLLQLIFLITAYYRALRVEIKSKK